MRIVDTDERGIPLWDLAQEKLSRKYVPRAWLRDGEVFFVVEEEPFEDSEMCEIFALKDGQKYHITLRENESFEF